MFMHGVYFFLSILFFKFKNYFYSQWYSHQMSVSGSHHCPPPWDLFFSRDTAEWSTSVAGGLPQREDHRPCGLKLGQPCLTGRRALRPRRGRAGFSEASLLGLQMALLCSRELVICAGLWLNFLFLLLRHQSLWTGVLLTVLILT